MSTTAAQILTRASYRVGENSTPNDSNEAARRLEIVAKGQRDVLRRGYFWFTEAIHTFSTTSSQEIYTMPTDFRDAIELRIDGQLHQFMWWNDVFQQQTAEPFNLTYGYLDGRYYIYNDELHILPTPSTTPSAISVTSITRSGTTATVTTSSAHGLQTNDYVLIAGAVETAYNGTYRVTVTSTTVFTYTVSGSPSTPATGTITATHQNGVFRYWSIPTSIAATSDTIVIPDLYSDVLVAYLVAYIYQKRGMRGDASDAYDEYNEIVNQIIMDHEKREVYNKNVRPVPYRYDPYPNRTVTSA